MKSKFGARDQRGQALVIVAVAILLVAFLAFSLVWFTYLKPRSGEVVKTEPVGNLVSVQTSSSFLSTTSNVTTTERVIPVIGAFGAPLKVVLEVRVKASGARWLCIRGKKDGCAQVLN